ncbi:exodeoxyribonuclease V subunit beta [uncultured Ramlibacter sp.]|uniref:UvrD-helicase domain-containing protein n=1 Tax=uncultured Ramlibacter sp. TaxID=260755 RepID=UPI0026322579|nr:UvrD-helicase domain-containing protein [uncultured Ramlibacter sp.]
MNMLAYEHNGERIARAQFYAIACDPRRSVAVEACAGAGKTWMLVSRILRALLEGAKPHEILAITFTKKAAGEMRQRLYEWLEDFAQASPETLRQALIQRGIGPEPAPELVAALQNLYQTLLATGRPVQVRTFHSWFAALLRSAPLQVLEQLGLPANYELLEDDSEAIALVWRRFHTAVAAQSEARLDFEASVAAHGRSMTQKGLLAALAKRVEFGLADAHGVVQASVKPWDEVFPEFTGVAEPADLLRTRGAVWQRLAAAASALGRASQTTFSAKGVELEQALSDGLLQAAIDALLTQKGEPRKFSDKLAGIEQVRQAQELVLRIGAAGEQHAAWLHQQRMARLARLLMEQFAALKRERGWVDMNDVERAALVMLSDPVLSGWVQERLDARIRHLLIDEFQDTNPLQWQALNAWLSGYAGAGNAPSVFIVGDPKQSIYRFRRAEPQVFRAAQGFVVEGLGGDLLSCDHTHRNAPELMAVVNEVMLAAQEAGQYEGFRPHTTESTLPGVVQCLPQIERAPRAAPAGPEPLGWRDSLTQPRELPEEKLVALECRQAAQWLAGRIAQGAKPGDFMVLARKRDRLALMEQQLRALRIPAQQPEKNELGEAPEVQDLVALLDVLVSPAHDLSLARALKSPLFGIHDDDLVQLALLARRARHENRPTTWFELLQQGEQLPEALAGLGAILLRWKQLVDTLPPHDALEAVYHQGDVLARFAQAAPAPLRASVLANLRALLGAALQVDGARYGTPYAFVRALKAGGVRAPVLADAAAVRLLTVHGAKGLEAPIVLLLDTDGPPARSETMGVIVEWPGEAPAPWRFAFIASESRPPACSAEALAVERTARQREELNALYVAMTRARQQLVLSSVQPHIAAEASWWQRLALLCAPLEPAAAAAANPAQAQACAPFEMLFVPLPPVKHAQDAIETVASEIPSDEALFGQAMHSLLETRTGAAWTEAQLQRVAREFKLEAGPMQQAAAMASRILAGEGAWAWDGREVDWQGNEVELFHEGELLRLDRLVRRGGQWWVLDYKSASRPERDAALLAQMRRYRVAVGLAYPGAAVKAAFLTGQGRLVEVE